MPESSPKSSLPPFKTFGECLKFLRQRARLSQRELSIAVGYSESQISRLEGNLRPPDLPTLSARFAPALDVADDPQLLGRLLALAAQARGDTALEPEAVAEPSQRLTLGSLTELDEQLARHRPPSAAASATYTFLFTDIEGSTRLRLAQPEAFPTALAQHDALLRRAIELHGGRVFRTMGDAFCAAFDTAGEAVGAALAAQSALHAADWGGAVIRVRCVVHAGAAALRDDDDYSGLTLAQTARLLAAAHGGQTLISAAAQALAADQLPVGATLRDLGEHQLRDLARPVRIFQLHGPGLPEAFPPLRTTEPVAHNLPLQLTSFIGRQPELHAARRLLSAARLLTLTGPGGTGKTRLALQLAAECRDDFAHGVWLVELAPIAQPAHVPQAVAQALGLYDETRQYRPELLSEHLLGKRLLLILDNCEHLVAACAELAERLLRTLPDLRLLTTSREALGVAGERTYPVPALPTPDPSRLPPLEELTKFEAVQLFVDRATAVRPDFALSAENALAVARICRALDGIPLAIELAAARARALSVEQIAARLEERDRFRLLTGGSRTAAPRQQTLRGAIDWSYELLSEAERALLRRLSVFAGGWTLEAAEQTLNTPEVLDLLAQLVSKSLVQSEQPRGQPARFRMLETIREYGQEKLAQAGELEAAQDTHLAFCIALAEEAEPHLRSHGQADWLTRVEAEGGNMRAALAWAVMRESAEAVLRLAGALAYSWYILSYELQGLDWLEAGLELAAGRDDLKHSPVRAKALLWAGRLAYIRETDLPKAAPWLEECLALYQALGDSVGSALAMAFLSSTREWNRDQAGDQHLVEEALRLTMTAEDGWGIGVCLRRLGSLAAARGDRARAVDLDLRSIAILRDEGDQFLAALIQSGTAFFFWLDGDGARARALLEENVTAAEAVEHSLAYWIPMSLFNLNLIALSAGDYTRARSTAQAILNLPGTQRNIASGRTRLGQVDYLEGRLDEARAHFEAGLKIFRELNDTNGLSWVPPWLGAVAYRAGDLDRALALIDEGLALETQGGFWPEVAFALHMRGDVARALGQPAAAADAYARSLRIVIENRDQPDVAERLEGFAKLAAAAGQPHRAARLFGAALALRERIGLPIPVVERADYDRAVALVRDQLGPAAFDIAAAEGRALTWEQAAAYALEQ